MDILYKSNGQQTPCDFSSANHITDKCMGWLTDWCLTPTLAVFQQYHEVGKNKRNTTAYIEW